MIARVRWTLMFWVCAIAILVLALIPAVPHMPTTGWDKSNHVLAFAVLTILGVRAYPARIAAVLAGAFLYGGLIELLQSFTTYRLAELGDLIADGLGVLVGYGLGVFLRKFYRPGHAG